MKISGAARSPLLALVAALLPVVADAQSDQRADSLRTLQGVQAALRTFENRWRTEIASHAPAPPTVTFAQCERRITADWCYGPNNGRVGYTWYGTIANADRYARDVTPAIARKKARKLITDMLASLKAARSVIPRDQWIAGQLVRINLERGDPKQAVEEAIHCTSERWWCDALSAHVFHLIGNFEEYSDQLWTRTLYQLPLEERCRWLDPSDVINSDSLRRAIASMHCAERVVFAERLWWLSDPLYLTRGNERRSEHLSRQVALMLDAFSRERLDSVRADMIARGEMQIRHEEKVLSGEAEPVGQRRTLPDITRTRASAPSQVGYGEVVRRLGVPGYLHFARPEPGSPPPIVALFPNPRYSFVPSAAVLTNPVHSSPSGWLLEADDQYEFQPTADRQFVDLEYQVAFFRRGDSTRMVAAVDLERFPQLTRRGSIVALVARRDYSDSADYHERPFRGPLWIQTTTLPNERTLVSLEILSRDSSWAGRVRFGAGPPPMPAQRVAMSDIMFVDDRPRPPTDLRDAEPLAHGRTRFAKASKVGLFWEMYGLARGDSGTYTVRVVAERSSGGILGMVSRAITGQPPQELPAAQGDLPTNSGLPAGAHGINLDLKSLSPGRYTLSVEVRVNGQQPVESVRAFEITSR